MHLIYVSVENGEEFLSHSSFLSFSPPSKELLYMLVRVFKCLVTPLLTFVKCQVMQNQWWTQ
jgi:hypothetical protein